MSLFEQFLKERIYIKNSSPHTIAFYRQSYQTYQRVLSEDTTGFFTAVKSQMDARYEILRGVQNELKLGKKAGEIFRGLERIRDREGVKLGEHPTAGALRSCFRNIFARDVLGKKELLGADKAIEDVQLQLSKPWVNLRKL